MVLRERRSPPANGLLGISPVSSPELRSVPLCTDDWDPSSGSSLDLVLALDLVLVFSFVAAGDLGAEVVFFLLAWSVVWYVAI